MFSPFRSKITSRCIIVGGAVALHLAQAQTQDACCADPVKDVVIRSKRLDTIQNGYDTHTGAITYSLTDEDLNVLPLGRSTPLNEILLQTPGAVQDAQGQVHFRGEHGNVQYRINGVALPESVSGFAPSLDAHFADHITTVTGALPAQYGLRTATVVDMHTTDFADELNEAHIGTIFGTTHHQEINADTAARVGDWQYFASMSLLQNNLGINNITDSSTALHDQTQQNRFFAMASYRIDASQQLSFIAADAAVRLQIPNRSGAWATWSIPGVTTPDSSTLNAHQQERNSFQIISFNAENPQAQSIQTSFYHRVSSIQYFPDALGDLLFNGVAANTLRQNEAYGLQMDSHQLWSPSHTLRWGLNGQVEQMKINDTASVFDASASVIQIVDNHQLSATTWGAYVQDEYQLSPSLTLNYGLRWDSVNTLTQEHQLSPRLGLVYDMNAQTRWHVGYARYFTPPSIEKIDSTTIALFNGTSNQSASTGNSPVLAERSHYWDAGVLHLLTKEWSVGMNGYYKQVQHLQDEGQFGNALIYSAFNYNQGRIAGLEWTTAYHTPTLHVYANLARSAAYGRDIESGQFNFSQSELDYIRANWVHLDHDQAWTASSGVSYTQGLRTYHLNLTSGTGMRSGDYNLDHLPGYASVNAALLQKINTPAWGENQLRFSIMNVLDRSYELRDGSSIGVGAPQWGQRRTLYVGITHRLAP